MQRATARKQFIPSRARPLRTGEGHGNHGTAAQAIPLLDETPVGVDDERGNIPVSYTHLVLIDFFATWCGPCRALAPTVDEIAEERAGKLRVLKCDIDQQPDLANRFGIMSVPTLVLIKEGRTVETMVGAQPKSRLLAAIDQYLK